jgi:hypothetical protein
MIDWPLFNIYEKMKGARVEKCKLKIIFNWMKKNEKMRGKMKGKTKIFGIGAAFLLVTVAVSPAVIANDYDKFVIDVINQISNYFNFNKEKLNYISQYIKNLDEIPKESEIPKEIVSKINLVSGEIEEIVEEYEIHSPLWKGKTSFWRSDTKAKFFNDSDLEYFGWLISLNKAATDVLINGVLLFGWTALTVILYLIGLIPVIGPWLVIVIGWILLFCWPEFYNFIKKIKDSNQFGCMLWFFYPPKYILSSRFIGEPQPKNWDDPIEFHNETTWTKLWPL